MKWWEVGENCIMRSFIVKEDEMDKACSTNGEKRNAKAKRKETTRKTKT
jgi:hypothetical protein